MKNEKTIKLFNSITNISDENIEAAVNGSARRKKAAWVKYVGLAACLALTIFAGALYNSARVGVDLPMLRLSDEDVGMGFEGYMAYDISELVNGNPWSEDANIKTLPVYKNNVTYDIFQNPSGYSVDEMREYLSELVDKFGLDKENLTYRDNTPSQRQIEFTLKDMEGMGMLPAPDDYFAPDTFWADDGNTEVSVNLAGVHAEFESRPPFPNKYDLGTYNGACDAAEYLKNECILGEYRDIWGLKNPQINISGGEYNIYGERLGYHISFNDKGADIVENIINYNFHKVSVYSYTNAEGQTKIRISSHNNYLEKRTTKLGDYPIISADKARELLLDGYYATSVVQWEMPGEEYIAKTELIYRAGIKEEIFMPYYRFYIELPEVVNDNGTKTFGAYYVPAVEGRYIENMPKYDGGFN